MNFLHILDLRKRITDLPVEYIGIYFISPKVVIEQNLGYRAS